MRKCLCIPVAEQRSGWVAVCGVWMWGLGWIGVGHLTYRFPSNDSFEKSDFLLVGPLVEGHCSGRRIGFEPMVYI